MIYNIYYSIICTIIHVTYNIILLLYLKVYVYSTGVRECAKEGDR